MTIPQVLRGRLSLPIIASPLFIVSQPELVLAQCRAGIVGSFPALNARPPELLDSWILRIKSELAAHDVANEDAPAAPFAVNQIAHESNQRLDRDLDVCVKHEVPIIITSLRVTRKIVDAVHSYGGIVLHDVISVRHAKRALDEGVDGLIAVCAGGGGYASPLSAFALVPEIRSFYDGTLVAAGAIADGPTILGALALGADLTYVGSRFIATKESSAKPAYKQALIEATAKDIVYTSFFSGTHGNYLAPSIARAGLDPFNLPPGKRSDMDYSSVSPEMKHWKDIWACGQGVGSIHDVPTVAELVERLKAQFSDAKAQLAIASAAFPPDGRNRGEGVEGAVR